MKRRIKYAWGAVVVALAASAMMPSMAVANDAVSPVDDHVVIDGVEYEARVMPGFDPHSDVQFAGSGDELSRAQLAASCRTGWVVPGTGTKYTSVQGCSVIGWNASAKWTYDWEANFNSSGRICAEGKGFLASGAVTWRGLGCNGSGSGTVPWGNTAANLQMRGYVTSVPIGWAGSFG